MTETATVTLEERGMQAASEDAAWASINTPLGTDELLAFCREDVERLFRINPYLEFTQWECLGDNHYAFAGRNSSQEQPFDFALELTIEELEDGLCIHYLDGLKNDTLFKVESSPSGSKLTIHENYSPLAEELQEKSLGEVDRSLTTWAGDIQNFLIIWKQWRWLGPWRWYMNHVWQKMKPSGRRVAYMFWWITLVEVALIVLGAAIYFVEYS
jgi:hypothetical protein